MDQYERLVIETALKNSQSGRANETSTIKFLGVRVVKSKVYGDTIVSYLKSVDVPQEGLKWLISGNVGSEISVRAKLFSKNEQIVHGQTYVDYYSRSDSKTIKYVMKLDNMFGYNYLKLTFKWFEPKQGEVILSSTCANFNSNLIENFWFASYKQTLDQEKGDTDSEVNKQYSLIISKLTAARTFDNYQQYTFAIMVLEEIGFFRLSVEVHRDGFPSIGMNEIAAGKSAGDIINMQLRIPRSEEEYITVDLRNYIGAADVFIRECKDKFCVQEQFTRQNYQGMNSISSHLEDSSQIKSLSFQPNCVNRDEIGGLCTYIIGVLPQETQKSVGYQLEVFSDISFSSIQLRENELFENKVLNNDYQFYILYLQNPSNIQKITVRVSSALVQIYASVDNACMKPTPSCSKPLNLKKGLNSNPIVLTRNETQHGAVYISVYGYASTIYSLIIEVATLFIINSRWGGEQIEISDNQI